MVSGALLKGIAVYFGPKSYRMDYRSITIFSRSDFYEDRAEHNDYYQFYYQSSCGSSRVHHALGINPLRFRDEFFW